MESEIYFPIVDVIEVIHLFDEDAHFEIVSADELELGEHAVTDIPSKTIKIREDIYEGACKGVGRDRMTLAHEFAHFITLCVFGFKLARNFCNIEVPAYRDPEWQAKCLAGELMVDSDLVKGMTKKEVAKVCGVSYVAAKTQVDALKK